MKYTIDTSFPTRAMTSREEKLIDHITSKTLFLEKELFFNIDSLMTHTSLVLSGEKKTRLNVPDPDEIRREIEQLEQLSDSIINDAAMECPDFNPEDSDHRNLSPEQYSDIIGTFSDQKKALEGILASASVPVPVPVLGEFGHDASGRNMVVLYVNNIDAAAGGDSVTAMCLMAYTLIHEYWHSFFHNVGIGKNPTFSCAEEPMAEFGSLVFLDYLVGQNCSGSSVFSDLSQTLQLAINEVQKKQTQKGFIAAYGFGYYLYDNHLSDAEFLLSSYANISSVIDPEAMESKTYRYLVYPVYPANEKVAFFHLKKMMAAAETNISSLPGSGSVLFCRVKRTRLDAFKNDLIAGNPNLSNAQIKNAIQVHFAMRQHPEVMFTYRKIDGTLRHAVGTLMIDLFDPPTSPVVTSAKNSEALIEQRYFDTEKNGWRKFKYDNLISIGSNIKLTVI